MASGSKGNAYYLKSQNTEILVDDGLSVAEVEKRLKQIGKDAKDIKAIFLTHEHNDHISGVVGFCDKYGAKLFVHSRTRLAIAFLTEKIADKIQIFDLNDFYFEDLTISPFMVSHDAVFPLGFSFYCMGKKVSILTDSGYVSPDTLEAVAGSDIAVIESNHDENMLLLGSYPAKLKRRIAGREGHLSNVEAARCAKTLCESGTKTIILAHLSEKNNLPSLALETTKNLICNKDVEVCVATQNAPTKLFIL